MLLFLIILSLFCACEKGAGEGGTSLVVGEVWAEEWDDGTYTFHTPSQDRYGADEDVYLVYGSDVSYSQRLKASPSGKFEFKYLRKGTYTVYVYSGASVPGGKVAIEKTFTISENKSLNDIGRITIKK